MTSSTDTRTSAAAILDPTEVERIVKAHLRRTVMLGRGEFTIDRSFSPDDPLTLHHFLSDREFTVEIRAFEVTGHEGG